MFFFGKKKPATAMDGFIHAMYGNPPLPKRANACAVAGFDLAAGG
jgi:hypothetical protein